MRVRNADLFVVGLGGSVRVGSSTELVVRSVLSALDERGVKTELFTGPELMLPPYEQTPECSGAGHELVEAVRRADGIVVGSPGYHGSISGLVKNVLDYLEELREDGRPYLDGRPVGCVATAYGWQAAVNTLTTLRQIVHALRGWPTPLGIALNAAGGLTDDDGAISDPRIMESIQIMATQIFDFAAAGRGR